MPQQTRVVFFFAGGLPKNFAKSNGGTLTVPIEVVDAALNVSYLLELYVNNVRIRWETKWRQGNVPLTWNQELSFGFESPGGVPKDIPTSGEYQVTVKLKHGADEEELEGSHGETQENNIISSESWTFRVKIGADPELEELDIADVVYGHGPVFPFFLTTIAEDEFQLKEITIGVEGGEQVSKEWNEIRFNDKLSGISLPRPGKYTVFVRATDVNDNTCEVKKTVRARLIHSKYWNLAPLLMFPVKLETRYLPENANQGTLWVRIFPDQVFFDTHEPKLTAAEKSAGERYWEKTNRAAWRHLVNNYGPKRAAWIRQVTRGNGEFPLVDNDQNVSFPLPKVRCLPSSFHAALDLVNGEQEYYQSNPVTADLMLLPVQDPISYDFQEDYPRSRIQGRLVGPDNQPIASRTIRLTQVTVPDTQMSTDSQGNFKFEGVQPSGNQNYATLNIRIEGANCFIAVDLGKGPVTIIASKDLIKSRWMTDLHQAHQNGLAIPIPWSLDNPAIERLIVAGKRDSDDPQGESESLKNLLNGHHYSTGMSFLPYGTATNNTENNRSGYSRMEKDLDKTYDIEVLEHKAWDYLFPEPRTKAQLTDLAFGLGENSATLRHLEHAGNFDDSLAKEMRTALWPLVGNGLPASVFSNDNERLWVKNHFLQWVAGNGPLPGIRVGNQPYGILPATSFRNWTKEQCQFYLYRVGPAPAREIKGRILNESFRPLPPMQVHLKASHRTVSTDENGFFRFQNVAENAVDLTLQGKKAHFADVRVQVGEEIKIVIPVYSDDSVARRFLDMLQKLADQWLQLAKDPRRVPRIGATDKPDDEIQGVFGMEPRSVDYTLVPFAGEKTFREYVEKLHSYVFKPEYQERYRSFPVEIVQGWIDASKQEKEEILQFWLRALGGSSGERLTDILEVLNWDINPYNQNHRRRKLYFDGVSHTAEKSTRALISALCQPTEPGLSDEESSALIYHLLKNSLSLSDADDTVRQALQALLCKNASEFFNEDGSGSGRQYVVPREFIEKVGVLQTSSTFPGRVSKPGKGGIGKELDSPDLSKADWGGLKIKPAWDKFKLNPDIDGLFRETLDLFSHRLDAWVTSVATRRLFEMREKAPTGIQLGAYGWVENLEIKAEDRFAVSEGYIHAPSRPQAAAAAMLYNSFLTHRADQDEDEPYCINLNSERVRKAKFLLDGIREGQPLGAMLGYHFERALHERNQSDNQPNLDQYIDDFRLAFPITATVENGNSGNGGQSREAIAARNVVDGLALVRWWTRREELARNHLSEEEQHIYDLLGLPRDDSQLRDPITRALRGEIKNLAANLDGMEDLLAYESAYQTVQGNYQRSGAVLAAAAGKGYPPELESVRTPVQGKTFGNQVAWVMPPAEEIREGELNWDDLTFRSPDGGQGSPLSLRQIAEPRVHQWLEACLPRPENLRCSYRFRPQGQGTAQNAVVGSVSVAELGLSPADLLYLSASLSSGEAAELDRRIALYVRLQHDLRYDCPVEINLMDKISAGTSLFDVLYLCRQILHTLGQGTFLKPSDCGLPSQAVDFHFTEADADRLQGRLSLVFKTALILRRSIEEHMGMEPSILSTENTNLTIDEIKVARLSALELLQRAGSLAISVALPDGADDPELENRLEQVRLELARRIEAVNNGPALKASENPDQRVATLTEAIKILLGRAFIILPTFTLPESARGSFVNFETQPGQARLRLWLQECSEVHRRLRDLEDMMLLAEAENHNAPETVYSLHVAQFPFNSETHWLGLSEKEIPGNFQINTLPKGEALSMVVAFGGKAEFFTDSFDQPWSGITIHKWNESIPDKVVNTHLGLHYNAPNNQAPQSWLMAVPEVWGKPWEDARDLINVVRDTTDLVKIRAVDVDAMGGESNEEFANPGLGRIFPALIISMSGQDVDTESWKYRLHQAFFEAFEEKITGIVCRSFIEIISIGLGDHIGVQKSWDESEQISFIDPAFNDLKITVPAAFYLGGRIQTGNHAVNSVGMYVHFYRSSIRSGLTIDFSEVGRIIVLELSLPQDGDVSEANLLSPDYWKSWMKAYRSAIPYAEHPDQEDFDLKEYKNEECTIQLRIEKTNDLFHYYGYGAPDPKPIPIYRMTIYSTAENESIKQLKWYLTESDNAQQGKFILHKICFENANL